MEISKKDLQNLNENYYILGQRSILIKQLQNLLGELSINYTGVDDAPENLMVIARLTKEREDTVSRLRSICEEHGDNEWPDDAYLADVVSDLEDCLRK